MGLYEALTTKSCHRRDAYPHRGGDFPETAIQELLKTSTFEEPSGWRGRLQG